MTKNIQRAPNNLNSSKKSTPQKNLVLQEKQAQKQKSNIPQVFFIIITL